MSMERNSEHVAIRDWPENERPREKLLRSSAESLSDAELLAILIGKGTYGQSALAVARQLLGRFNGLRGLFAAQKQELIEQKGIGESKYALIKAVTELAKRSLREVLEQGVMLDSPQVTFDYLRYWLAGKPYEVFCVILLDNQHRVIRAQELFRGTLCRASVYPREVIMEALRNNAAAIILAHNHPSGVAEPSQADRDITKRICDAANLVDLRVLDHIVIGDETCVSFAERAWL